MSKRTSEKKKKGFSLIELIIVLAVMAIIALIAIPNFTAVRENAKVKSDIQSGNAIARTIETLLVDESVDLDVAATAGSLIITFTTNESGVTTAATVANGLKVDTKIFADVEALETYVTSLVDVKSKPQANNKTQFVVDIGTDKKVTVTTN